MRAVVPAEGGDAVARFESQREQGGGEAPGADREVAVGVALDRLVGEAPDDLVARVDLFGAPEDGRQREGIVHHQAVHAADCMRNGAAAEPRLGARDAGHRLPVG